MHEGNPPLPLFLNQRRSRLGEISGMERADCDEHLNFPQELLVQKITMADKIPTLSQFQYLNSERSGCERLGVVQGRDSRLRFVRCCSPQFFAPSGAAIDGSCSSYQSLALSWDTEYQFVKVLKANIGGLIGGKPGRTYYITFQVKDMAGSGSPTLNFRAVVKTLKGQATVTFSALEP